jgi:hypothetical protein
VRFLLGNLLLVFLVFMVSCKNENMFLVVTPENLAGDWLLKEYVLALIETKSPLNSYKKGSSGQEYLQFSQEANNIYRILIGHSFNYASNLKYDKVDIEQNGFYSFSIDGKQISSLRVKKRYDNELVVDYPESDNFEQTMLRVTENLRQFINETIIAGNYITDSGIKCSFSADGRAILPNGKSILYEINLNPGWQKYDWLRDTEDRTNIYIYIWDEDKLLFYDAYYEFESDSINPTGNPIILTKVS